MYFQHIPAGDSLATIQSRRLVTATPYKMPAPAALVNDALLSSFSEVPPDKVDRQCTVQHWSYFVRPSEAQPAHADWS